MQKLMVLEFTDEERKRAIAKCNEIIDSLKAFSENEKWLIISTLHDSFPKENLKGVIAKEGDVLI